MTPSDIAPKLGAFRTDLLAVLDRHLADVPAEHLLAITAHLVGQMIAMQDQRRFTAAQIMDLVSRNIEAGNQSAIETVMNNTAGHC